MSIRHGRMQFFSQALVTETNVCRSYCLSDVMAIVTSSRPVSRCAHRSLTVRITTPLLQVRICLYIFNSLNVFNVIFLYVVFVTVSSYAYGSKSHIAPLGSSLGASLLSSSPSALSLSVSGVGISSVSSTSVCGTSGLSALGSSMDPVNPVEVLASIQSRLDIESRSVNSGRCTTSRFGFIFFWSGGRVVVTCCCLIMQLLLCNLLIFDNFI